MNNNFLSKIDPELDGKIVSAGMGKWLYYPNQQPLVMQIETLNYDQLLCHVSLSKRGEGLFLTSFPDHADDRGNTRSFRRYAP